MGIKKFYGWLSDNFSQHIYQISKNQNLNRLNTSIDVLMVDMNGLYHDSCQRVFRYGNSKPSIYLKMDENYKPSNIDAFNDICKSIENTVKMALPKKELILCVDGSAPISKQNQQRQRRFKSSKEASSKEASSKEASSKEASSKELSLKEENEGSFTQEKFNPTCITPGTVFMHELSCHIESFIKEKLKGDWKHLKVLFSSEKVPGEGEHKCINYIRKYGDKKDSYCVFGMDADLIMLTMGTKIPNIYILREDHYRKGIFNFINVGNIRLEIAEMLRWESPNHKFQPKLAIFDFIFLCFSVGNDFLPHIPSIEIIQDGLELIFRIYKIVCRDMGHLTQVVLSKDEQPRIRFKPKNLQMILYEIGTFEKENLEAKLNSKRKFFPEEILTDSSTKENDFYKVDIEKYLSLYGEKFKGYSMERICHEYLKGMQWVLYYYTTGVPDWTWCFSHHYAPPASVLAKYASTFKFYKTKSTLPNSPFLQLLCVLPPKNSHLLPPPLDSLLHDKDSKLAPFCPEEIKVDIEGKCREWEGIVLLPIIDQKLFRNEYEKLVSKVNLIDLKRNIFTNSKMYCNNKGVVYEWEFKV